MPEVRATLDAIIKAGNEPNWDALLETYTDEEEKRRSAEIYATLTSVVSGEALSVVRGVMSGDGWEAWSRLALRYDPKTPAKSLMSMMVVMQPRKIKDIRELPKAVQEWEVKVKALKAEHDITLAENIQVALLTSFLPPDMQDYVFQWSDGKTSFNEMKDKILALAVNRASLSRPMPMETDQVKAETEEQWDEWWENGNQENGGQEDDEEEKGVNYVGENCSRCGGHGHYAR